MATKVKVAPSAALVTRADTPIEKCVRMMQEKKTGSVLIISDDEKQQLIGIFTERDLLKHISKIQDGGHWNKPVRTVMSHPIKVLHAAMLDRAADIMVKNGFRHLPVVVSDEKVKYRLIGVISMRDLFVQMVRASKGIGLEIDAPSIEKRVEKRSLGVVTADPYLIQFLDEAIANRYKVALDHLSFDDLADKPTKSNAVFLDLDSFKPIKWIELLKKINKRPIAPLVIIVFTPSIFDAKTIGILELLGASKKFEVLAKPLAIQRLFECLNEVL